MNIERSLKFITFDSENPFPWFDSIRFWCAFLMYYTMIGWILFLLVFVVVKQKPKTFDWIYFIALFFYLFFLFFFEWQRPFRFRSSAQIGARASKKSKSNLNPVQTREKSMRNFSGVIKSEKNIGKETGEKHERIDHLFGLFHCIWRNSNHSVAIISCLKCFLHDRFYSVVVVILTILILFMFFFIVQS